MKFKHKKDKELFWRIDPRLRAIICALEAKLWTMLGYELIITSTIRRIHDSTGIHACGRAVDVSIHGLSEITIWTLVYWMNAVYPYDPMKHTYQTALHHDVGYGDHIHIQVPPIR